MSYPNTKAVNGKLILSVYALFIIFIVLVIVITSFGTTSSLSSGDIDKMLQKKWTENKLTPSDKTNDEDFLRRVYIDLIGRVPKAGEVKDFLADNSLNKRDKIIDELLNSPEFGQNMADVWINLLFTQENIQKFPPATYNYVKKYFADNFNRNQPFTEFVYNLLSANGLGATNPNVLYLARFQSPEDAAGTTMRLFMGKKIQCAQCHKHPYENISQDDFWGVAAFFARTKTIPFYKKDAIEKLTKVLNRYDKLIGKVRDKAMENDMDGNMKMDKETSNMPEHKNLKKQKQEDKILKKKDGKERAIPPAWVLDTLHAKLNRSQTGDFIPDILVYDAVNGQMQYDKKGIKVTAFPKYLGGASVSINAGIQRRDTLAAHLTTADSRQMAKEFVNRFWKHFFGYGFVNPVDEFTDKDEISNAELLEKLTDEFVKSNFDVKHLFKLIVSTDAYQLSSTPNSTNKDDHEFFSRAVLRPLTPIQLANSLMTASGYFSLNSLKDKDPAEIEKIKTRIMKLFIFTFNDDEMSEAENFSGTITQALLMMNSDLAEKVTEKKPGNMVAEILNNYESPSDRVDMMYLNALSRFPSKYEKQDLLDKASNNKEFYEDLEWALLNSSEFIFNH
jgi:hypothetical protein